MVEDTDNEQDDEGTDRCAICGRRLGGTEQALDHCLAKHPRSDLLHNTLSDVQVRTECSECGGTFTAPVSVGIDAKADEAMLNVRANCEACVEADPISAIMVQAMSSGDVLAREVPDPAAAD
jgi:hypothetical protein